MEFLLVAGIIGAVGYWFNKRNASNAPPAPGSGTQQQQPPPGSNTPPVIQPQPQPPAPTPPPPVLALGPGIYPAGTPGAFPISFSVSGGDCDSYVSASPGDTIGPCPNSKTVWYGPGTYVVIRARVDGFAPFTAFDHWEGPGVTSTQNPLTVQVNAGGYVRGVFKFLGR